MNQTLYLSFTSETEKDISSLACPSNLEDCKEKQIIIKQAMSRGETTSSLSCLISYLKKFITTKQQSYVQLLYLSVDPGKQQENDE